MMNGLIPVLITTFNKDLSVDLKSQINLIRKFENLGSIQKYWLFGTGSEDWALDEVNRIKTLDKLMDTYGLQKFIIGTNLGSLHQSKSFSNSLAQRYGHDIITHYMNPYPKYNQQAIVDTYSLFMMDNPLKNFAYFSDNFTSNCAPNTLSKLRNINNLCGVKFSTSSGVQMMEAKAHKRDNFDIIPAVIKTLLANLASGYLSSTTVEANLFAPQILQVFKDFDVSINEARSSQDTLLNLMSSFKTSASERNYVSIPEMKHILSKLGIGSDVHSPELTPLSKDDKKYLDERLETNQTSFEWLQ